MCPAGAGAALVNRAAGGWGSGQPFCVPRQDNKISVEVLGGEGISSLTSVERN